VWWNCVLTSLALSGGVYICRALPNWEIGICAIKKEKGAKGNSFLLLDYAAKGKGFVLEID
jgi:hypothetical protein